MKKVSIVIPAHNEEERFKDAKTLDRYLDFFSDLKKNGILDFEIIVVLNSCTDKTKEVVEEYGKKLIVLEFEKAGKGFAITEGFKQALKGGAGFIGFVDADCSTPPEAFYDLVKNIKNVQGVIANRWDKRSLIKTRQPFLRRVISRGYNFIVRVFFMLPHNDTQCGAKLFRRELLEKIVHKLGASEWGFDVDLLFYARREGAKVKSIPTIWEDKQGSKVNLRRTPLMMFLSAVRLRLIHSPLRFMVRIYRKLPKRLRFHH